MDPNMNQEALEYYKQKKQSRQAHPLTPQQQQQLLYQQYQMQQVMKQRQSQHNPQPQNHPQAQSHPQQQQQYHQYSYQHQQKVSTSQPLPPKQYKSTSSHRTADSGHTSSSNTNTGTGTSLKAKDLLLLLKQGIALLPGGRDKRGGPVLCFPSNSRADELNIEDLYILVRYLTFLPDENVKKHKFSVVIDMRSGTTFQSVKPILKVVEECIGNNTEVVFIIKPDKFLEKHKAQMASGKFVFDIQIVSVNSLYHEIDQSQLTKDFDGQLPYNNDEWIQIRICLEDFFTMAHDMSDKFSSLLKFLERKDSPDSVAESKRRLEEHESLIMKINQAPVHVLETESEKLNHWLRYGLSQSNNKPSWVAMNPDYQQLIPQVKKTVQQLYEYRDHLQHKWKAGRGRLEQINQLRLFEDDIGRMSDWLNQQRHLFLSEYHDIGQSASQAADLYAEHRQFLANCSDVREQVSRLTGVANMLVSSGHFASSHIQAQARKLEHIWKTFTTALEDRSNVLQLSASFHARAEAFVANCPHWETAMKQQQQQPGSQETVTSLSQFISTLKQLWEEAQMAHEEVCSDGRALASHLSSPVPKGSHTSLAAAVDYSEGRKHCTHLMHELWTCFKRVETVHAHRKKRLTARLSLLMFREDVAQVLAWLNDHGDIFLKRQTSVGKTLLRSETLYNAHMQFEEVAANTLTNAEKLIAAADDLVAQAHSPEEILQEETELERRIKAFTKAIDSRRNTLDLAVGFHNHTKDLFRWIQQLKNNHNSAEMLPPTIGGVEEEKRRFHNEKRQIHDAADRVLKEGSALCDHLIEYEEKNHFEALLIQVENDKENAINLLNERQVRLDLCLQLRLFEADVASAIDCFKRELPTTSTCYFLTDPKLADSMSELEEISSTFQTAIKTGDDVIKKGHDLGVIFESVGVNFPAGGSGSNDSGVVDSCEYAVERIQRLKYELVDLVMPVDKINMEIKIELDWRRLKQQSHQILTWISQCDDMIRKTAKVPKDHDEAEHLKIEHDKIQPILNEAHPQAATCAAFAETFVRNIDGYLKKITPDTGSIGSNNNSSIGGGSNHPVVCANDDNLDQSLNDSIVSNSGNTLTQQQLVNSTKLMRRKEAQTISELVADQWQKLVYAAEEKHKLLNAAAQWYETSEKVTSVLRSLDKEYRKADDWCQNDKASQRPDLMAYLEELLSRHFEQKEAFLKACILARRTSDQFIKYLGRQPAKTPDKAEVQDRVKGAINDLMAKEQAVLQAWAARKGRLDECLEFIRVKMEAEELMMHFDEAGVTNPKLDENYRRIMAALESKHLSHHTDVIKVTKTRLNSRFANQLLLKTSQLSGVAGSGTHLSPHAPNQQGSISPGSVSQAPPGGSAKLRSQPSNSGSIGYESASDITNRASMSSTGSGGSNATVGTHGTTASSGLGIPPSTEVLSPQNKAAKKRAMIIDEILKTERDYVNWLEVFISTYYKAIYEDFGTDGPVKIPQELYDKREVIFSNIKEVYEFHRSTFLPGIQKYAVNRMDNNTNDVSECYLPEDIGHFFIRHHGNLKNIYLKYFLHKYEANKIILEKASVFSEIQKHYFPSVEMKDTMQSCYMQPVQRVMRYGILLAALCENCEGGSAGELKEAHIIINEVNKRINDEICLKDIRGLPEDRPLESFGDLIFKDDFTVWEPRQIIKKNHERVIFLFDVGMLLTKQCSSSDGISYQYKSHVLMTECNITEHIEGDQCKFALWTGRVPPVGDYRLVLKGKDLEVKQKWVRALRNIMQERIFSFGPVFDTDRNRMTASSTENMPNSDSIFYVLDNFKGSDPSHLPVDCNQRVILVENRGEWALVRKFKPVNPEAPNESEEPADNAQGFVPSNLLINVATRRCLEPDLKTSGSGMKKWLRDRRSSTSEASRHKITHHTNIVPTTIEPQTAAENILDNVSEESADVEIPPPMALKESLVILSNTSTSNQAATTMPNMQDKEPLTIFNQDPQDTPTPDTMTTNQNNPIAVANSDANSSPQLPSISNQDKQEDQDIAKSPVNYQDVDNNDTKDDNVEEEEDKIVPLQQTNLQTQPPSAQSYEIPPGQTMSSLNAIGGGPALPAELDELGMALEKNLRLSRQARQETERYQVWQQHIVGSSTTTSSHVHLQHSSSSSHPQHHGTLDSVSSKTSRASQDSDKALSTSEMSQSSCSGIGSGYPIGEEPDLPHHLSQQPVTQRTRTTSSTSSPILSAPRILDLPGNGDERLLGELKLSDDMCVSSRLWSNMHEAISSVVYDNNTSGANDDAGATAASSDINNSSITSQHHFAKHRLLLYECGVVLITDIVETSIDPNNQRSSLATVTKEMGCVVNNGGVGDEHSGAIPPNDDDAAICAAVPTVVQCKHVLTLARTSIKDDVSMGIEGGRRSANKLLWFCLYEEGSNVTSTTGRHSSNVMCHIIDPLTPDARARWLTELSLLVKPAVNVANNGADNNCLNIDTAYSLYSSQSNNSSLLLNPSPNTSESNNTNNNTTISNTANSSSTSSSICNPPQPPQHANTNNNKLQLLNTNTTHIPTSTTTSISSAPIISNNSTNGSSKVPSLFHLKSEPMHIGNEKTSKSSSSGKSSSKKSSNSKSSSSTSANQSKRSSKGEASLSGANKKETKHRTSSGGSSKKPR